MKYNVFSKQSFQIVHFNVIHPFCKIINKVFLEKESNMRKLMTILGSIGLIATTITTVVACTDNHKENLNPIPDPGNVTKTLLNEKLTINDDGSITVVLFYYDGSEVALLISPDDGLNSVIKELKIKIDQINQSLDSNSKELATTTAGLSSFEQTLLKNSRAISEAQVLFDGAETKYKAVEKIFSSLTDENSDIYQHIKGLFEITKGELNQAQKQLTYAKNIYKMNAENEAVWTDKITWLEDNVATIKDEKLATENDLLTLLETGRLI